MCGRFTLRTPMSVLVKQFRLFDDIDLQPAYNIAPTQSIAIVRDSAEGGKRHVEHARWGLVPFWAKDTSMAGRMINARGETVAEKPAFRQAFKKRRCLVPADGYYEWQKRPDGKQPFWITLQDESPFAFAGLWERWEKGDEPLETCTIITTSANSLTEEVHDRMPVILRREDYDGWLDDAAEPKQLTELLQPFPSEFMQMREVSRYVNKVQHQGPECLAPPEDASES